MPSFLPLHPCPGGTAGDVHDGFLIGGAYILNGQNLHMGPMNFISQPCVRSTPLKVLGF